MAGKKIQGGFRVNSVTFLLTNKNNTKEMFLGKLTLICRNVLKRNLKVKRNLLNINYKNLLYYKGKKSIS